MSLFTEAETCVMYEGLGDQVIIISNRGESGKIPVRTIAEMEIAPGRAGNVMTIRNHGGEAWRTPRLGRKSSRKVHLTVRQRMRELEEEKGTR